MAARENVKGSWNDQGECEQINESQLSHDDLLREKVDQLASKEEELLKNLGQYVQQQT